MSAATVVLLLVLVSFLALTFGGCLMCLCLGAKGNTAPARDEGPTLTERCGGRRDLPGECRASMSAGLRDPGSADFAGIFGSTYNTAPDCTQTYRSSVEAKNGLGVLVKTEFMCTYNPKTNDISFKVLR